MIANLFRCWAGALPSRTLGLLIVVEGYRPEIQSSECFICTVKEFHHAFKAFELKFAR